MKLFLFCSAITALCISPLIAADVAFSVKPVKAKYVIGEPVVLQIEFNNVAAKAIVVDLGDNELTNISIRQMADGANSSFLTPAVRRGGGRIPQQTQVDRGGRFTRYVVLDQWLRPSKPGVHRFEMRLKFNTEDIVAPFQVQFEGYTEEDLGRGVSSLVEMFMESRKQGDKIDAREALSLKWAFMMACTYLADAPESVWTEAKVRYGEDAYAFTLIKAAKAMGPGGILVID